MDQRIRAPHLLDRRNSLWDGLLIGKVLSKYHHFSINLQSEEDRDIVCREVLDNY